MAQHTHLFTPGAAVTFTAEAAVTAGQLVIVTGDRQVSPATAKAATWVGTAAFDAAIGESVTILKGGVQKILASGVIAAGDVVVAGAAGTVATLAAVTTPTAADVTDTRAIVGIALTGGEDVAVEIDLVR